MRMGTIEPLQQRNPPGKQRDNTLHPRLQHGRLDVG